MRLAIVVGAAIGLASCDAFDSAQLTDCERALKFGLKSPSSYKRINVSQVKLVDHKPPYLSVMIEYDADNSYGAAIRGTELCSYRLDAEGRPTTERIDDNLSDEMQRAVDNALDAAANPAGGPSE